MTKTALTSEQIQQEVRRRLLLENPADSDLAELSMPLPKHHPVDAHERNWDMERGGQRDYRSYVRRVIDEGPSRMAGTMPDPRPARKETVHPE